MDKKKLGEALLKANKISKDDLKYAFTMHDKIGGEFSHLLVKLGYVSDEDITDIIGKIERISTIDISSLVIPAKLVFSMPRDVIEKHDVMPIARKGTVMTLAMADVNNLDAIEEIQFLTNLKVEPVLASRDAIRRAIVQFYEQEESREVEMEKRQKPVDEIFEAMQAKNLDSAELQKILIFLLIEKKILSSHEILDKIERWGQK